MSESLTTCEGVLVPVQRGELFAIMAGQRIPSIALVSAQTQAVRFTLRLQVEAAVGCVHLLIHPVL